MKLSSGANKQVDKKVVINGANGYVASNFILELLNNGYQVVALVRKKEGMAAADRMKNVLLEMSSDDAVDFSRLEVYDYSLFKPDFNLPENVLKQVFEGTIHYFHFAASLKFDINSKEEIFGTNMQGVTNSVETFLKFSGKGSRFYFISTAYSCGTLKGIFQERFYPDEEIGAFRNYYEQSKRFAENRLRQYIEEDGLNCCILRISQIVGQKSTGITKTDYGIFDFSKRIQRIAALNPGTTLRMQIDEKCTQNLLPIDTMVSYFMDILQTEKVPPIINIISKKPVSNRSILEILEKLLPIKLVANMKLSNVEMTKIERIMAIGMSFTGAYININPTFETRNLDALVTPQPEITPEDVFRMVSYFLQQRKISRQQNTG
ncbi:SDR family oxidoreductase [Maribellus sediminis]|uniref:SDR family oxidoreductase n=1 Tax=Maribellus sediminis TaxID=2696285 RepID=UPI00142FCA22|nr:SDR family oxidoreductase [Maribellus sediminis]